MSRSLFLCDFDGHADADFLHWESGAEHFCFGYEGDAVAGIGVRHILRGEVVDGLRQAFVVGKEVKAADDACDARVAADTLGVFDDVTDAAVGAAGDDEEAVCAFVDECAVFCDEIWLPDALPQTLAHGVACFKIEGAWDLAEEDQMLTDPPRRTREAQIHALGERFCAVGHADGEALAALWPEAVGMRCERHAAMVTEGKERWQPARVVVVPVGEHDLRDARKIDAELCCILHKGVRIACIKKHAFLTIPNEEAQSRLAEKIAIDGGIVVNQHGEFHGLIFPS